jgi:hypothetical protein
MTILNHELEAFGQCMAVNFSLSSNFNCRCENRRNGETHCAMHVRYAQICAEMLYKGRIKHLTSSRCNGKDGVHRCGHVTDGVFCSSHLGEYLKRIDEMRIDQASSAAQDGTIAVVTTAQGETIENVTAPQDGITTIANLTAPQPIEVSRMVRAVSESDETIVASDPVSDEDITTRLPIRGPITNAKQGSLFNRLSVLDSMLSSLIDQVKTIQSEVKHIGQSVNTLAKVA